MAAFSMSAIIDGVASTGMSPDPIAIAVTASVTVNWLVCVSPISIISLVFVKIVLFPQLGFFLLAQLRKITLPAGAKVNVPTPEFT
jgi:hypothetical protein